MTCLSSINSHVSMLFYNDRNTIYWFFYPLECSSNNRDFERPFSRVNLHMLIETACLNLLICDAHSEQFILYVIIYVFGVGVKQQWITHSLIIYVKQSSLMFPCYDIIMCRLFFVDYGFVRSVYRNHILVSMHWKRPWFKEITFWYQYI
jgi:hypothetical protein